jgi:hypothetical protein
MWPWGRENWINNLSPFHIRLSFGDWLRPVVKGIGVGINRVFSVTVAVTSCYSTFGFGTWIILSLVGPAGVVGSSLEAPSSSADVRVCSQNLFCFGNLKFCLEFVWVTRRLAGGRVYRYIAEPMWDQMDGGLGLALFVCVSLSFCRVKIMFGL